MKSELAVDVNAEPRRIFELAANIERWPALLPHYKKVTAQSRDDSRITARMYARRPLLGRIGIPVAWTAVQWADDSDPSDLRLRFQHVRGATRGMDVTWHIRRVSDDPPLTRVTIEHVFSRALPVVGPDVFPSVIDRLFVRPIAGRTLATFKSLAERPG